MTIALPRSFAAQLKTLRETVGYTQEELATIAGLSVYAVSALERGQRRRPQFETVRALSAALDLTGAARDAFAASARAPDDHPASGKPCGVSLPLSPTTMLGRDAEMRALRSWLVADAASRLITITGPGGVGKTRVALELARGLAATGALRVQFVPLAATRDPAVAASAIAEALGLSDVAVSDLPGHVRAACHDRPTLMLLDNLEQVLSVAPLVAKLLSAAPALRLLATSRSPLCVRGEREYVLGPLTVEVNLEGTSFADLAHSPAVRLFVERVRDVQTRLRLTSANVSTVAAICRRLGGLPLALELAAPWIKVLTAEELLSRLSDDVLHSSPGAPDLPERQKTMNATVAWSYQLLDRDEQRAFRRFGALPGLFPLDAAEEVLCDRETDPGRSDAALQAVAGLIDKGLLLRADTAAVTACSLYLHARHRASLRRARTRRLG